MFINRSKNKFGTTSVRVLRKRGNNNTLVKSFGSSHDEREIEKDGSDVKSIAKYDDEGKKVWEIHTTDHKGLGAHYHLWSKGKPIKGSESSLTEEMYKILKKVRAD